MIDRDCAIEMVLRRGGYRGVILGCDEVGRGPLAGPATVACVAFGENYDAPLYGELDDSKKLRPQKRIDLVEDIKKNALAWAIVDIAPADIDRLNILQACLWGMARCAHKVYEQLGLPASVEVIVDGNRLIPDFDLPQSAYVKGDGRSWSIAAASILAKVHRDGLMQKYDEVYPGYGFAQNVGYPTAAHRRALAELGPTPIHRRSFHIKET